MKLGNLLNRRKDISGKIEATQKLLTSSLSFQEGAEPVGDPEALLRTFMELSIAHAETSLMINRLNEQTSVQFVLVDYGDVVDSTTYDVSMSEAVGIRSLHQRILALLTKSIATVTAPPPRWGRNELVTHVNFDHKAWEELRSKVAANIRTIDETLQEANWSIEVSE